MLSQYAESGNLSNFRGRLEAQKQVVIHIRKRMIVVLPDQGRRSRRPGGDQIWVGARNTLMGKTWHAAKIPANVPPDQANAWLMSRTAKHSTSR